MDGAGVIANTDPAGTDSAQHVTHMRGTDTFLHSTIAAAICLAPSARRSLALMSKLVIALMAGMDGAVWTVQVLGNVQLQTVHRSTTCHAQ